MSIVCGTNFSTISPRMVEAAGVLANRLGEPLILVHAVDESSQENLPGSLRDSLALYARAQLHDEKERLRALPTDLVEVVRRGAPDAVLLEEGAAHRARLLVLGAAKRRSLSHRLHGDVSERVAEAAPVPTLVLHDPTPLLRWARGERRLRVFVAADFSAPSDAALEWVAWLRQLGPCDVVVAYLEPSISAYPVGDFYPSPLMDDMMLKIANVQKRCFRQRVRSSLGRSRVRVRFELGFGRSDARLLQLAAEERADLVVVGTHSRVGWHRVGHHSVSRGVLHCASTNVACVPVHSEEASSESTPQDPLSNFLPVDP